MRSSTNRRPQLRPLALALVLAAGLASGCDSPACVFTADGCTTTGTPTGALGSAPAAQPVLGSWIRPTAPTLIRTVPSGAGIDPRSPVVLRFDETLAEASLTNAFQLRTVDFGAGAIPLPTQPVLVGEGRMLVLVPTTQLPLSTQLEVVLTENAQVTDLTGQQLGTNPGTVVTSFTTAGATIDTPTLVATYPQDGAFDESERGEIVAVFDRDIDPATMGDASWIVEVDGAMPVPDPAPSQAQGIQLFGIGQPIPRVWRWQAVDGAGVPVPLGREVEVTLTLSPAGDEIADEDGGELAETTIGFRTASVLAPTAIRITSAPTDAIGIDNLTPGSGNELFVEVDVDGAEDGDRLDIYFFGTDPNDPSSLIALRRAFDFVDPGPVAIAELLRDGLDLTSSTAPLVPRLADGSITIAASFTSGPITTPVVLSDATLDTTAPTFVMLDRSTAITSYRYDAGDVVFEGVASEALRGVEITTSLASSTVGAQAFANGTRFASEPLELGVVTPASAPLPYSLVGFDRAGNRTAVPVNGTLTQRGFAADTPLAPAGGGDPIQVEVFDAVTLAPLEGAVVLSHAVPAGGGAPTFVQAVSTGADGSGSVLSHANGDLGTILTAELTGYDLTSVHLFGSARVSIPLEPTGFQSGTLRGTLSSTAPQVQSSLSLGDLVFADGRSLGGLGTPFAGQVCTTSPFGDTATSCPFGPVPILDGRSGSLAAFNGAFDQDESGFFAITFMTAFELAFPIGPVPDGSQQVVPITADRLLADPSVPAGQGAIDLGLLSFDASGATGLDTLALEDDPLLPGAARVWVEADLGGSQPPVPAGLGLSFDQGGDVWNLRGAVAGGVIAGLTPSFDPSQRLSVVVELEDMDGARVRRRASLADIALGGSALVAPPVPRIAAPLPGTDVGGGAFTIEVDNALVDGAIGGTLGSGLYRLRLEDASGRAWNHWRPDVADVDGNVLFFVVDPADAAVAGLSSGSLVARASAWAIDGFDPLGFYFTDVRTEATTQAVGASVGLSIP